MEEQDRHFENSLVARAVMAPIFVGSLPPQRGKGWGWGP